MMMMMMPVFIDLRVTFAMQAESGCYLASWDSDQFIGSYCPT